MRDFFCNNYISSRCIVICPNIEIQHYSKEEMIVILHNYFTRHDIVIIFAITTLIITKRDI